MDYEAKWKAERERSAFLALADGTIFRGVAFGARVDRLGEAVFNTGMTGYQEIVSDPSYAGQIVALTAAEIGNYGVAAADAESRGLFLSGLVANDLTEPSNFRSEQSLPDHLAAAGVPGLYGADTRRLALHVRDHGCQKAYLHASPEPLDPAEAVRRARDWPGLDGQDYAARVSTETVYDVPSAASGAAGGAPLVAVYDFGVKSNILRSLAAFARVRVFPAATPAADILAARPDGVFLSNGPADPAALPYAAANVRALLAAGAAAGRRLPIFGICLGHQLLALACGARTGRLAFGHHGCNHPVRELATGAVRITSQNHNFTVLPDSLPPELVVTHVNLNDGSVEGLRHAARPAFSVQFHPEACPGPHDAAPLFARFRDLIRDGSARAR